MTERILLIAIAAAIIGGAIQTLAVAQGTTAGGIFGMTPGSTPMTNNLIWRINSQNGQVSFCWSNLNDISKAPRCSPWGGE